MITVVVKGKEYNIYTKEEADKLGIKYVYWVDVEHPGEYALTDNDYVIPLLGYKDWLDNKGKLRRNYKFPYLNIWFLPSVKCIWTEELLYTSGIINRRLKNNPRTPNTILYTFIKTYIYQLMTYGTVDYRLLARIVTRGNTDKPGVAKRMLKLKKVRAMLDKEIEEFFKKHNITKDTVIQIYEKARAIAEDKQNSKDLIMIADRYAEFLRMNKQSTELPVDNNIDLSKLLDAEERKILDIEAKIE